MYAYGAFSYSSCSAKIALQHKNTMAPEKNPPTGVLGGSVGDPWGFLGVLGEALLSSWESLGILGVPGGPWGSLGDPLGVR